jgi:hypothetical protein
VNPRRKTACFVYFIEAGPGGHIKIGVTADVVARQRDLQAANAKPLQLIVCVDGTHKDERRLHRRFKSERMNGEWFKGNGAVRGFALSLIDATPEERAASLAIEPTPTPKPKRKAVAQPKRERNRRKRPTLTAEQVHSMLYVGNGGSIYRSADTESLLVQPSRRDWEGYLRRQKQIAAEDAASEQER